METRDLGMAQCMNAQADKVHKLGMPHSDMHSTTWS